MLRFRNSQLCLGGQEVFREQVACRNDDKMINKVSQLKDSKIIEMFEFQLNLRAASCLVFYFHVQRTYATGLQNKLEISLN